MLQARFDNLMLNLQCSARLSKSEAAFCTALNLQDPKFFSKQLQGVQDMLLVSNNDAILLVR